MHALRNLIILTLLCLSAPLCLAVETVTLTESWARATRPSGTVGAAYLTITNSSAEDRAVVGGQAQGAGHIELHTHLIEDDVMRMVEIPEIPLPAGASVILKPGDLHIMLYDLEEALKIGASFVLQLELDDGEQVETTVLVGSATSRDFAEAEEHANDAKRHDDAAEETAGDCCGAGS